MILNCNERYYDAQQTDTLFINVELCDADRDDEPEHGTIEALPSGLRRQRNAIAPRRSDTYTSNDSLRLKAVENKIDRLTDSVLSSLAGYSPIVDFPSNLENCIPADSSMPTSKGDADMYHRQKLTINGVSQWRSFSSMQNLVDLVVEQVKQSMKPKSSKVLFGEYMDEWYHKYKERDLNPDTREGYKSLMKVHILPAIGNIPVSDITVADVQRVMDGCKSASYAKQTKSIINLVLEAAIADEIFLHPNPTKDPRLVMPTTCKKREAVSNEDLRAVIDYLPKMPKNLATILVMLIMTGCRRGEALGTRWEDIDWTAKTIHLQRVVRFRNNRPDVSEKMKSKAANRTVSLWDEFIQYLGERQETGYIINDGGEPLTETQYRHRWNAIMRELKKAGIDQRFTAHQLRHSYATIAANSGNVPPKVLQGMLGHANFQTTMNIYAGFDNEKVREGSQNLSGEYSKLGVKSCKEVATEQSPNIPAAQAV